MIQNTNIGCGYIWNDGWSTAPLFSQLGLNNKKHSKQENKNVFFF